MDTNLLRRRSRGLVMLCCLFWAATPGLAQEFDQPQPQQQAAGQVATSSVGEVGQRQTREQSPANIAPMSRINNRVANRIQNRIRSRIDRNYDPQADSASPFELAAEQARTAGRR